jgi:phage shock protein A
MVADQRKEEARWRQRAEFALERGDENLAGEALQRARQHALRASRLGELLSDAEARVRRLKRHARDVEAGRGPPLAVLLEDPLEARFRALQQDEDLERDLQDLKAHIAQPLSTDR